ncbi:8-oxo-dGDP phosphatase NUDT18-like [Penaeus chinensis]|uniref:8-oxo-dGDP phosphatase NUDT18-like n=1 Tax=Penaeus chinensis TaxID=139456 RepID=UPI001FB7F0DB|nr:8-oxo-dGDP phosphatase NUDT18-like [Penaeus chinensis]
MDSIEGNIKLLLQGKEIEESQEFCDFTLDDQNEVTAAKGVAPSSPAEFTPILKDNVCFIVAAVLVNSEGQVLMMQEAKSSCAGQWYLPAGRMEPGESIVEAAKREVLEETGLEVDISTLLMVESASGSWFRFVVTGSVTGGELKTPACADKESLQAKWVENLGELSLRGNDIYPLIQRAKQYWENQESWHPLVLPVTRPHTRLLMRLVIAIRKRVNNRVCVLTSDKTATHLPVTEINPVRSLHSTLRKYMTEIFGSDLPPHRPQGVLNVELQTSSPRGNHDGLCVTILVPIRKALEEVPLIDKYSWVELPKPLGEDLLNRMGKNMIVPLNVIRVATLIN